MKPTLVLVLALWAGLIAAEDRRVPALLERQIPCFEVIDGIEGIGGVTMWGAVVKLRDELGVQLHFEDLDVERARDGLSLAEAIARLEELDRQSGLTTGDERRLAYYSRMATTVEDPGKYPVLVKVPTFRLTANDLTLGELLDRLVELVPQYVWRTDGTGAGASIVIHPREGSVLDWAIEPICGKNSRLSNLLGPGGELPRQLKQHGIHQVSATFGATKTMKSPNAMKLPRTRVDLCDEGITARRALTSSMRACGSDCHWTLRGVQGLRVLVVERLR